MICRKCSRPLTATEVYHYGDLCASCIFVGYHQSEYYWKNKYHHEKEQRDGIRNAHPDPDHHHGHDHR